MDSNSQSIPNNGTPAQPPHYTFAHKKAMTTAHAKRTAVTHASFLLPHLKPHFRILDVGCGPGSITCDFAALAPQGSVVGVDQASSVLDQGRQIAKERELHNVEFVEGDILKRLPFPDDSFDVVFTSMVLVHNSDPVKALREMKRVTKPGGMVANREGDTHLYYPELPALMKFNELAFGTVKAGGAVAPSSAGRTLGAWAREAGFKAENIQKSVSIEPKTTAKEIVDLAEFWAEHVGGEKSGFRGLVKKAGYSDEAIEEGVKGMREWGRHPDAWYTAVVGEMIARV